MLARRIRQLREACEAGRAVGGEVAGFPLVEHRGEQPADPLASRDAESRRRWSEAVAVLVALQAEYAAWLDTLPKTLRDGATGEALQAIVELDLDELTALVPPRGCGRD